MPVAIRAITRLIDADDVNVSLGVGVDEYALVWDNDTARFVLRAPAAPFAGILATGATVGATAQAQAFTLGVVSPFDAPAADSTTAWQVRKADKTTAVVTVDTTNGRVGIGTSAPEAPFDVKRSGTGAAANFRDSANNIVMQLTDSAIAGTVYLLLSRFDNTKNVYQSFIPAGALSASNVSWHFGIPASTNRFAILHYDGGASVSEKLVVLNTGLVGIGTTSPATRLDIDAGALTMAEMTAPTGVANKATLYTKDTGGGKTALCCKLGDDVEIILATQA